MMNLEEIKSLVNKWQEEGASRPDIINFITSVDIGLNVKFIIDYCDNPKSIIEDINTILEEMRRHFFKMAKDNVEVLKDKEFVEEFNKLLEKKDK